MSGKKRKSQIDQQVLKDEYQIIRPLAERFCEETVDQLDRLLNDSGVALGFPIQRRVKQWESLAEKFERVPIPSVLICVGQLCSRN